jgi:hypothetical protein
MLIVSGHPAATQTSQEFWAEELMNCRILLSDVNRRIHELEIESYTIDTGQGSESAKRSSLESLYNVRAKLLDQISELEDTLGIDSDTNSLESAQCIQVAPF